MPKSIKYHKGPLGWAVVGRISRVRRDQYLVSVTGFRPGHNGWAARRLERVPHPLSRQNQGREHSHHIKGALPNAQVLHQSPSFR